MSRKNTKRSERSKASAERLSGFKTLCKRLSESSISLSNRIVRLTRAGKSPAEMWGRWLRFDGGQAGLVRAGFNYGVIAGDGLLVFDIDSYRHSSNPILVEELRDRGVFDTFRVQTPHNGTHLYYKVPERSVEAAERAFGSENPQGSFGETRLSKQYVVGPGCQLWQCNKDWHECQNREEGYYEIENDAPLRELSVPELIGILKSDPQLNPSTSSSQSSQSNQTSITSTRSSGEVDLPKNVQRATEADITTLRQKIGVANDRKGEALLRWGQGKLSVEPNTTLQEYGEDRSKIETALAQKIWFYTGSKEETVAMMEYIAPPKWRGRGQAYKESVLSSAKRYLPEDPGVGRPQSLTHSQSGVIYEKASDILEVIAFRIGEGAPFTASRVSEALTRKYQEQDHFEVEDSVGEQQVRKVLRILRQAGYLTKKNRGGNEGINWELRTDLSSDLVMIDEMLEEKFNTLADVAEQRQNYVYR
ncbi:bifunctional DNA primase/polymerase [Halorhabdus salina]|uniref:bifunctional DNA primase/polymerase n=1 Tax=Halorhabdus salina TaxID=2750670 RepID=UPI0015EE7065|nr:bifunctional DNA primase/polymerase [Halorhabdus salina]